MSSCTLTTKDISILETMLERSPDRLDPVALFLRAKIDGARIVFREDIPETIATLNSRLTFRVDGGEPDTRIISQSSMNVSVGQFLPITTLRGLALLGMMQGQDAVIPARDGEEKIELLAVLHQPEAAQRRMRMDRNAPAPALRLIFGGKADTPPAFGDYDDDPGPSAA